MKPLFLLASLALYLPGQPAPTPPRGGFILLPFEAPPTLAARLPAPKPLLLPFRSWLLDRNFHLVTSVHRRVEAARRDALREGLDMVLLPSLSVQGDRLEVRLQALEPATGRPLASARESCRLPPQAGPAEVQALLPKLADRLYPALLRQGD